MPEELKVKLKADEANVFETRFGNNPALLLDDESKLKPTPRRWPLVLGVLLFASITYNLKQNRSAWVANTDLRGKINAADETIANNYLIPKNIDALAVLNDKADPKALDMAGRNLIAIACYKGNLDQALFWEKRGTDWNQPRWRGKFYKENGKTKFEREAGFDRSPIQIAAIKYNYDIIKYMMHPLRRAKIDWNYDGGGRETLRQILERQKRVAGERAPALLDELIGTLANL
tara:strand:+ start:6595 stop:7290 length:696 start_codon:yes stop_codon:yes gene_type:complete